MAKAPPSAKRDRIKAFMPALVDYTNDVIYGDLWERKASRSATAVSSRWRRWSRPTGRSSSCRI